MQPHAFISRLGFAHMAMHIHGGFLKSIWAGLGWIDWTRSSSARHQNCDRPRLSQPLRNHINPLYRTNLFKEPILYNAQNCEKSKMSELHINDSNNCFNNTNSFNTVLNNSTVVNEKSEILAWLSPLNPRVRHQDIRTRRVDEVGDWLLRTQEYRNWFGGARGGESGGSALLCYGGPGVGKTFIR